MFGKNTAEKEQFDVVLMDCHMPGMSGLEAARRLRQSGFRKPVLAVTASVMEQDRRQITQAGFDGYVGKPISLKGFLEAVRVALEGGRA